MNWDYCTQCGRELEYMGVRDVRVKHGRLLFSRTTGKPVQEEWWRCPERRTFYSPRHDIVVRDYVKTL